VNPLDRSRTSSPSSFHLDRAGGKFLGVCQGLANYLNIDPMIVRAVFVLGTLIGFGSFVLIYFVIALLAD
jgi:phage shock protein PspC (stress-responsive transcriptional regulator)